MAPPLPYGRGLRRQSLDESVFFWIGINWGSAFEKPIESFKRDEYTVRDTRLQKLKKEA